MYAIIEVGGKQYRVAKDDIIEIERLPAASGKEVVLDKVLLAVKNNKVSIGQPYLKEAKVKAAVLGELKGAKIISFKYRRRKGYHCSKGHRQQLLRIKIKEIDID